MRTLIHWYQKHHRKLPWRKNRDPYRVWISEIMLQQTRVEAVIPYYENFLKSFPTLQHLANADIEAVLSHWSGLGYYQRARQLHRAAQIVIESFDGTLPDDREKLLSLPGIGPYTVGAILSIAFGKREPIVDGNVIRVLTRLKMIAGDPKKEPAKSKLWREAKNCVATGDPGIVNQAIMELGATVCLPTSPSCLLCPLRSDCKAYAAGQVDRYPMLPEKKKPRLVKMSAALIEHKGKFLLVQRSDGRHLQAMWEFPQVEGDLHVLQNRLGEVVLGQSLKTIRHSIMDRKIQLTPVLCSKKNGKNNLSGYAKSRWIHLADLKKFPTSSLNQKIATAYQNR